MVLIWVDVNSEKTNSKKKKQSKKEGILKSTYLLILADFVEYLTLEFASILHIDGKIEACCVYIPFGSRI